MTKKSIFVICLSMFAVGIACFFSGVHFHKMKMQDHFRKISRGGGAYLEKKMLHRLSGELNLTPNQLPKVKKILNSFFERFDAIERRSFPIKRQNMLQMNSAFKQVLTAEQHEKLKEIQKHSFMSKLSTKKFDRRHRMEGPKPNRDGERGDHKRPGDQDGRPRGARLQEKPVLTDEIIIIEE